MCRNREVAWCEQVKSTSTCLQSFEKIKTLKLISLNYRSRRKTITWVSRWKFLWEKPLCLLVLWSVAGFLLCFLGDSASHMSFYIWSLQIHAPLIRSPCEFVSSFLPLSLPLNINAKGEVESARVCSFKMAMFIQMANKPNCSLHCDFFDGGNLLIHNVIFVN